MAKLSVEVQKTLQTTAPEILFVLKDLHNDTKTWETISILFRNLVYVDSDKVLREMGDTRSVDDAVYKQSRQNFYRGRSSMASLFQALVINAAEELERRENKDG